MEPDRRQREVREFQLEGAGLVVVATLLLVGLAGAFFLGRWYERRSESPQTAAARPLDAGDDAAVAADVAGGESDVAEDLTFFDTLGSEGGQAEPGRQARRPVVPEESPGGPDAAAAPAGAEGFLVQVFAGRVRQSAERLVRELRSQGYEVSLAPERRGPDQLFKVRVGGYATRPDAEAAAERLRQGGYPTAFVIAPE